MKQNPSRLKFKKNHKMKFLFFNLLDKKTFYPLYGNYAIKSISSGKLNLKQIEAGRKAIRRNVKKSGKLYIRVFTNKSVTSKPVASRMGKGKGSHSFWMCPVKKGQIIYELSSVSKLVSIKALEKASNKLPFKNKIVKLVY
jgi:large subunit ribosomal protein L16